MPVAPSTIVPTTPPGLEGITLQLLAKNPADRYANSGDLITDLRRVRAGKPPLGATAAQGTTSENAVTATGVAAAAVATGAATNAVDAAAYQPTRAEPAVRRTQTVPATEYEEVDEAPRRRIGMWILILLLLAGIGVMAWLLTSGKLDNKGSAVKVAVPSRAQHEVGRCEGDARAARLRGQPDVRAARRRRHRHRLLPEPRRRHAGRQEQHRRHHRQLRRRARRAAERDRTPASGRGREAPGHQHADRDRHGADRGQTRGHRSLAQNPPPSQKVPEQTVVTLQVAGPPDLIEIPDVTGQDQLSPRRRSAATSRSRRSRSSPTRSRRVGSSAPTRPRARRSTGDTTVTMTISAGTPVTTVPDVTGLSQSAASRPADKRRPSDGSAVREPVPGDPRIGVVITQNPQAGVKADAGLVVTVIIGQQVGGEAVDGGGATRRPFRGGATTSILFGPLAYLTCARKLREQVVAARGEHRLGMELHAFDACSRWRSP